MHKYMHTRYKLLIFLIYNTIILKSLNYIKKLLILYFFQNKYILKTIGIMWKHSSEQSLIHNLL
jgi:hypothetical protein